MLISDKFIYFELQKTGSTHVRKVLHRVPAVQTTIIGKHNCYHELLKPILSDFEHKTKIGNIRNPWDWYVSLWAYGCMGKGGLHQRLTTYPKLTTRFGLKTIAKNLFYYNKLYQRKDIWLKLYSDKDNTKYFKNWLKLVLEEDGIGLRENYKNSSIASEIGLFTFRYLKLFTHGGEDKIRDLKTYKEVSRHEKNQNFIDIIFHNESLNQELIEKAPEIGLKRSTVKGVISELDAKTNTSIRKDYRHYYDSETTELVHKKDKLIIDKYEYEF